MCGYACVCVFDQCDGQEVVREEYGQVCVCVCEQERDRVRALTKVKLSTASGAIWTTGAPMAGKLWNFEGCVWDDLFRLTENVHTAVK